MNVGDIPIVDLKDAIRPLSERSRVWIIEHTQDSLFAKDCSRKTESIDLLCGLESFGTIRGAFTFNGHVYLHVCSNGIMNVDVCEVPKHYSGREACWIDKPN